jgi:hypothetical protein
MPGPPPRPAAGDNQSVAERVAAQVASTYQHLQRSRHQVASAMAQVRRVDRLLHPPTAGAVAEWPVGAGHGHLTEVVEHEVAVHQRAVALHEEAARLQEAGGWPERAAAARAHAAHARELSQRAREELATYRARAAAAKERIDEAQQRLPDPAPIPGADSSRVVGAPRWSAGDQGPRQRRPAWPLKLGRDGSLTA